MTAAPAVTTRKLPGGRVLRDARTLYWWVEIVAILAYYAVYSAVRNRSDASPERAFGNARRLIDLERALGLYWEQPLHEWARGIKALIVGSNYFYGSFHFVVTIGVAVFLYRRFTDDYPLWRNTLAVATGLALIGFYTFPLMPPRLLPSYFGYVDTLAKYPTFWSFNSGAISKLSNQYAAMPSVHIAWALWSACVVVPRVRSAWVRAVAVAYPVLTATVIVLTANHYILDAVGGVVVLAMGYVVARLITRAGRDRAPATVRFAAGHAGPSPDSHARSEQTASAT